MSELVLPGVVSETSLELPAELSFEKWMQVGETLARIERSCMWWIGDWWRYGDHKYGERAAHALDSDTYSFQTFMDAGWVARKVETSRRREVLSWSHHREVAALDPDEQDRWLDRAEAEGLTRNELRREISRPNVRALPTGPGNVTLKRAGRLKACMSAAAERRMGPSIERPRDRANGPGAWHRECEAPGALGSVSSRVAAFSPDPLSRGPTERST